MPDRGWLGFSRRWWAAEQTPPSPVETISVGYDESDGGVLDCMAEFVPAAGAGFFSTALLVALAADLHVERILVRMSGSVQNVAIAVLPTDPVAAAGQRTSMRPGRSAHAAHSGSYVSWIFVLNFALLPLGRPTDPNTPLSIDFPRPGLLVPQGSTLGLQMEQDNQDLRAAFFFRGAA